MLKRRAENVWSQSHKYATQIHTNVDLKYIVTVARGTFVRRWLRDSSPCPKEVGGWVGVGLFAGDRFWRQCRQNQNQKMLKCTLELRARKNVKRSGHLK